MTKSARWFAVAAALLLAAAAVGYMQRARWFPLLVTRAGDAVSGRDDHDGGAHEHAEEHDHAEAVALTPQARMNLGLKTGEVDLTDYWRSITIPGEVAEQPGHSEHRVNSMFNGVVYKVHAVPGQSVRPGDPLVEIELTGEVLATSQANLLKTLQEIDLVKTDLERIRPLADAGTIPERTRIEREYELRRLEGMRLVQKQELLVRGLTSDQIARIVETRSLIRRFTIRVLDRVEHSENSEPAAASPVRASDRAAPQTSGTDERPVFTVEQMHVFPGKLVQPGDELCDLAHHTLLMIQGQAFEREAELVARVMAEQWPVTALFEVGGDTPLIRDGLKVLYADNVIDVASRTFRFYLPLLNEVASERPGPDGTLYRSWRFKPGQKVRLLVPVEHFVDRIVVPADAVVSEGIDAYVFRVNGNKMERQAVHVEHRDSQSVVIANDGSLFPGDTIALNGAYQLQLALKNASGGAVDPHAGHSH